MENAPIKSENLAPTHQAAMTPADLLQIAVSQNADIDKMSKLMDLHIRWEEREAKKAWVQAMTKFKEKPPTIIKDQLVEFKQTRYKHANLAKAVSAITTELSKYDLTASWSPSQSDNMIHVTCSITHAMGHTESVTLSGPPDESGGKNKIQAIGSTISYLERYTLFAITGLAAADQDDDGQSFGIEFLTDEQQHKIADLLLAIYGEDQSAFFEHIKCESVEQIPRKDFSKHKSGLEAIISKRKAK